MIIKGSTISPGKARGIAYTIDPEAIINLAADVPATGPPEWEAERLHSAVGRACVQLDRITRELTKRVGSGDAAIFQIHAKILRDPSFIDQIEAQIHQEHKSAESAVSIVVQAMYSMFASQSVPIIRDKAADIVDIGRRLVRCLQTGPGEKDEGECNSIIVTHELSPSEVVSFYHKQVQAFITETCGPKSHTAILARSLGIPMLTGVKRITKNIPDGTKIFVDASGGFVFTNEDANKVTTDLVQEKRQELLVRGPVTTADGVSITLLLSISHATESLAVPRLGADGVGLWRLEFLFMDRTSWPTKDEISDELCKVAEQLGDAELAIRLADFGAEKCPVYADIPVNRNPSLGLRGLRLLLQREDILDPQLRAIIELAYKRPLTLLLPMLDSVDTLRSALNRFCRIAGCSDRSGLPFKLAAMIELPSAAIMAAEIMKEVDAVSIGVNDLTQYTLAADRDDELVEHYHDPMHPAIIRLLKHIVDNANSQSKPVTACGDLAGDIHAMSVMLALGIQRFSVSQVDFMRIAAAMRKINIKALAPYAEELAGLTSATRVREFIKDLIPDTATAAS